MYNNKNNILIINYTFFPANPRNYKNVFNFNLFNPNSINTVNQQNKSIPNVKYNAQTFTNTFLVCSSSLNLLKVNN